MYVGSVYLVLSTKLPNVFRTSTYISIFHQGGQNNKKKTVCRFPKRKVPAANLFSRKQGLGIPMHIKMTSKACHINEYTLFVLDRLLYMSASE